jgi:glycosyltransferase involved in cell wall biosynthesis
MNIYLDNIIFNKVKHGGVSNYWFELIKYLEQQNQNIKYFEGNDATENFHRKQINLSQVIKRKSTGLERFVPIKYKTDEKLLYHSSYYRGLVGAKNQIEITTVYDFIHSFYSNFPQKQIHNFLKFNAIKRSKGIICISHNTYNDLNKFYKMKPNQKATVIHVGVSEDYYQIEKSIETDNFIKKNQLDNEFIVFVGGRTTYKNFDFVVEILNENTKLNLAVVGGGQLTEKEKLLFKNNALERVTHFSSLENNELNILFNYAQALVYPSSYEGFGIPVVEAMRAGCAVIGLNNATIREVAEESAILLNKLNVQEFNTKFSQLKNTDLKQNILSLGLESSKKYSWEKCSKETNEFYELLYDKEV